MITTWIRGTGILLLLFGVAVTAPGYAGAEPPVPTSGAVLYELTENLSLKALSRGQRKATSQLQGIALAGTPLCPAALAGAAPYCIINATGSDNISLTTGKGNFGGTFTVVSPFDNATDGPELVIGRGHFSGKMDFSPAILSGVPLGTVEGEVGINGSRPLPFTGVFRLPFVYPALGHGNNPLYLIDPTTWDSVEVAPTEQALGYATVKFEISFPPSN
ncbi:MAG TPA: hypothetical protein VGL14_10705 [Methylomirabilota bacterium]